MRPVSEATSRIAGKSFSRKYIALGRIVNCWQEIVGPALALKAQPVRLQYRKQEKDKYKSKIQEVTLEIAVAPADATLLHYQKDLILERINRIFGERWITAIRFVPEDGRSPGKIRRRKQKPLTEEQKNYLSEVLGPVTDGDIRARLETLGESMMAHKE